MIKAVIYDMDGILINSEPLWRKAMIKSFATANIHLTEEMCKQTMGSRMDEVIKYWLDNSPQNTTPHKHLEELILKNIIQLVKDEGEPMKGVKNSLDFLKSQNIKIGLASSSAMALINTTVDKLQIRDYFEIIHSAEFEDYGKPHPGVYITTAKKLAVNPQQCTAIEDSINGMIAAKAAKMKCIAIPEKELMNDKRLGVSDIIIQSLLEINEENLNQINKF